MDNLYRVRGTKVSLPYPPELTPAEIRLIFSLEKFFSPENIFPDLFLPKVTPRTKLNCSLENFSLCANKSSLPGSDFVQIDCLTLSEQGIFIFESKDYSGWIYGSENQKIWTETLDFGREKQRFYNPILQNALHVAAVDDFLNDIPIYSIIVFGRNATLKDIHCSAKNTIICTQSEIYSLFHTIPSKISPTRLPELHATINSHRIIPNSIIRRQHIEAIQKIIIH